MKAENIETKAKMKVKRRKKIKHNGVQCRGCCSVLLKGNIWTGGALPVTKQGEETVTKGGRAHSSLRHWEANKFKDGNGDGQVKVRWNHTG